MPLKTYVIWITWSHFVTGALVDFLKSSEGSNIPINTLIDMASQASSLLFTSIPIALYTFKCRVSVSKILSHSFPFIRSFSFCSLYGPSSTGNSSCYYEANYNLPVTMETTVWGLRTTISLYTLSQINTTEVLTPITVQCYRCNTNQSDRYPDTWET